MLHILTLSDIVKAGMPGPSTYWGDNLEQAPSPVGVYVYSHNKWDRKLDLLVLFWELSDLKLYIRTTVSPSIMGKEYFLKVYSNPRTELAWSWEPRSVVLPKAERTKWMSSLHWNTASPAQGQGCCVNFIVRRYILFLGMGFSLH